MSLPVSLRAWSVPPRRRDREAAPLYREEHPQACSTAPLVWVSCTTETATLPANRLAISETFMHLGDVMELDRVSRKKPKKNALASVQIPSKATVSPRTGRLALIHHHKPRSTQSLIGDRCTTSALLTYSPQHSHAPTGLTTPYLPLPRPPYCLVGQCLVMDSCTVAFRG